MDRCHHRSEAHVRDPPAGLDRFSGFYSGERAEYVKLVLRQLRCGKTILCDAVRGGGTIFPVGKHGAERQLEVWNGARVSAACARPPPPRWLASPSCFACIHLRDGQRLRVWKRDGRCFFDQLLLPSCLREFMGRLRLTRNELMEHGAIAAELKTFVAGGVDPRREVF